MAIVFDFLIFICVTAFIKWCYKIYRINKMLKSIPGPTPIPFFGVTLPKDIYEIPTFFEDLVRKYGKTFKYYVGTTMTVTTFDPELLKHILSSTKHISKSTVYDLSKVWLKDGLIVSSGQKWNQRRKLLNPSFHISLLKKYFQVMQDATRTLIEKFREVADKGTIINVQEYFELFSLDIIGETSFGVKSTGSSSYSDAINTMTKMVFIRCFSLWKRFDSLFYWFAKEAIEQENAIDIIDKIALDVIETRRKEKDKNSKDKTETIKRANLIEILMEHPELSDHDIHEEINNFIFGGYDTTSSLLSFATYELAKYHEIQDKLYEEIKISVENNIENLTFETVQSMKYLDQVVKEALRLRPVVSLLGRKLIADAKFGDTVFPKGIEINILLLQLHNDSFYFPNPEKFDPERFSKANQAKRHPFAYLPFSAGPRSCIGQKFGLLEAKLALAMIVWNFKIFSKPDSKMVLVNSGVLKSKYGFPVRLERRK